MRRGRGDKRWGSRQKTNLDSINRVDVPHAVDDDSTDLLERLERTHGGDCVSLNEDVAVCEEFDGLFPTRGFDVSLGVRWGLKMTEVGGGEERRRRGEMEREEEDGREKRRERKERERKFYLERRT